MNAPCGGPAGTSRATGRVGPPQRLG